MEQFNEPGALAIHSLLANMLGRRVVVIGDAMLDHYLMGSVERISPEAPVPVINFTEEHYALGGAANVAQCAAALGVRVELIAVVGRDSIGHRLKWMAKELAIQVDGVLVDHSRPTTYKTRIMAGNQHVVRIDREWSGPIPELLQHRIVLEIQRAAESADAFILTDYAKGVLSECVCQAVITAAKGKPVIVDPKGSNWDRYQLATVIKPNAKEAEARGGSLIRSNEDAARVGRSIGRELQIENVIVTLGARGSVLVADTSRDTDVSGVHLPSRQREVFDVTGAGDTVAATLAAALAGGATMGQATWLANAAAGVCVGRLGAAPVSQQDIISALDERPRHSAHKVINRAEAMRLAAKLRTQGKRLVFTNGCFDLLHVGHVSLLEK
jgi:D-beta-D-heptose 7-phosphate kinase / D-beta-D-heptose 1-phosphate adenosyltransferase